MEMIQSWARKGSDLRTTLLQPAFRGRSGLSGVVRCLDLHHLPRLFPRELPWKKKKDRVTNGTCRFPTAGKFVSLLMHVSST